MKQTELMFFFDTEDFTSEIAAEAIKREADIMTEEGVTGHFSMVALLAEKLRDEWKRKDILDSLAPHIIGTHTYRHSWHPTIMEMTDFASFDQAYRSISAIEDKGLAILHDVFPDKKIMYACPPGNCDSYVAMYYYADRGIPYDAGSCVFASGDKAEPYLGCGIGYNGFEHLRYTEGFDYLTEHTEWIPIKLDDWVQHDRVILYTHPNIAVKRCFWDDLNYKGGNLRTPGNYIEAPDRSKEEIDQYYSGFRTLIRAIKADPRYRITNLNEIYAGRKARTPVRREDVPMLLKALGAELAPVGEWSVSDIFLAAAAFLSGKDEYVPGKAFGFLTQPYAAKEPFTASKEEVLSAVNDLDLTSFLPDAVLIGEHRAGPADLLLAMLEVLTGKETVVIAPKEQLVSLDAFPNLKNFRPQGTWLHSEEFLDTYVSDRLRLQCWTLYRVK